MTASIRSSGGFPEFLARGADQLFGRGVERGVERAGEANRPADPAQAGAFQQPRAFV